MLIWFLFLHTATGQSLHFSYDFDHCDFQDHMTGFPAIVTGGNPICVCGLGESSIQLDGDEDYLEVDASVNTLFSSNFTLDFYFWLDESANDIDIMSLRSGCGKLDSMMQLRYFNRTNEISFEIGSNINNYYAFKSKLNLNHCWHRFSLVKFGLEYQIYLDNELMGKFVAKENINLTKVGKLYFGNNPCNVIDNAQRFKGKIDELKLYSTALADIEIVKTYLYPDRIITPNTTIFKGESIQLETGASCASSIRWSPVESLSDAFTAHPVANPENTTTYMVTFNNGTCISTDTVRINTADKDNLDCKNLLLPKAFTPNNDGLNDTYGISNTFIVEQMDYFEIYDRWGGKVWETKEIKDSWDGTKNANPLNNGTYMYKIKYRCNNEELIKFDSFILLK